MTLRDAAPHAVIPAAVVERPAADCLPSAALFRGRREVIIVHRGQEYRLRITKADKLILTK